jgi:hydroxymethylpyrimidine/phosphomethylpyrimidine kinase
MADIVTDSDQAKQARAALEAYYQRQLLLEGDLRKETKETLVLYVAAYIMWRGKYYLSLTGAEFESSIAAELEHVRKWRDSALWNNRNKRLDSVLARIKSGEFGKPRRRRKRRKVRP